MLFILMLEMGAGGWNWKKSTNVKEKYADQNPQNSQNIENMVI